MDYPTEPLQRYTESRAVVRRRSGESGPALPGVGLSSPDGSAAALFATMLLVCPVWGMSAEHTPQTGSTAPPTLEFIEFLGSFETDAGEWIDPTELIQPEFDQFMEASQTLRPVPADGAGSNAQPGLNHPVDNEDK